MLPLRLSKYSETAVASPPSCLMLLTQHRDQSRQFFLQIWQKYQQHIPLEPLESVILEVILAHPEYHAYLTEEFLDKDYRPDQFEDNPFLHLGLHIAIQEQLQTDRPAGIRTLYQTLKPHFEDIHSLEHQMMLCLAQTLLQAQVQQTMPDEDHYLTCLKQAI